MAISRRTSGVSAMATNDEVTANAAGRRITQVALNGGRIINGLGSGIRQGLPKEFVIDALARSEYHHGEARPQVGSTLT